MTMFSRSVCGKLGFAIVTLSLVFSSGQMALAADEGHGNPGQFVENIRKGLSGISKYFWSPKSEAPAEQKTKQPAAQEKSATPAKKAIAASKKAEPAKAASKPTSAKSAEKKAVKSVAKPVAKPLVKPVKKTPPVQVTKAPISISKKLEADKKPVDGDKKKDALQAALARSAIKETPEAAKTAILPKAVPKTVTIAPQAKEKLKVKAKEPETSPKAEVFKKAETTKKPEVRTKIVEKAQARQKQPVKVQPEKKAAVVAPRALDAKKKQQADQPHKAPKIIDVKPVIKKQAKLAAAGKNAAGDTPKQPASEIKRGAGLTIASKVKPENSSQQKPKQQLANRKTGTHIWLPDIGSQHSRQFGLTGIPAHRLAAKKDLERTDGRWVFAPYREGMLPSIYGLSDRVHAANDDGVWVGEGRNWIYVFARKRTYSSIIGGVQKKTAKVTPKKNKASEQKGKKAPDVPGKTSESAKKPESGKTLGAEDPKQVKATNKPASKAAAKSAEKTGTKPAIGKAGNRVKILLKKDQKSSRIAQTTKAGQASKTGKGGNWTKVNGRWVYVPAPQVGQTGTTHLSGLASQVEKAPVTGGWVQRNGRWVYVAPQRGQRGKKADSGNAKSVTKSVAQPKKAKAKQPRKVSKKVKPAVRPAAKTGLAEGPDEQVKGAQVTRNQKNWVRKGNRWVYLSGKTAQAGRPVSSPGVKLTGKKARKNPVAKTAGGQFYFFVPGQQPGTGTWYSAPMKMLGKAKKIDNPANFLR